MGDAIITRTRRRTQSLEGALPRAAALVVLHAKHSADDVHLDLAGAAGVVHGRLIPGLVSLHGGC